MIRNDTLMRFIRIFSELANSIRYSVNKRVMLEMALIKLCKPEAEKDELSLIERIRKLERMIEQGIAVPGRMPAPAGVSASSADDGRWDRRCMEQTGIRGMQLPVSAYRPEARAIVPQAIRSRRCRPQRPRRRI